MGDGPQYLLALRSVLTTLLLLVTGNHDVTRSDIELVCDEGARVAEQLGDQEQLEFFSRVMRGLDD